MKPERVEEILAEHFAKSEPEGARERVLSRASAEMRPPRRRGFAFAKWAFAAVVAVTILSANVSDHARQARLAQGQYQSPELIARAGIAMVERNRMAEEMVASAGPWGDGRKERKRL